MDNPSFKFVADAITRAIQAGSFLPIADGAASHVANTMFKASIKNRLDNVPDAWKTDQRNVLRASKHLGALATIIADLHHVEEVQRFHIEAAAAIVQQHCEIRHKSGHWCDE